MSTRKTSTISKPWAAKVLFTVPEGRDFHKEAALMVSCTLTNLSPGHFGPPLPRCLTVLPGITFLPRKSAAGPHLSKLYE